MIAKDPRLIALESLRQKKGLRDHGGASGITCMLNPEYLDFIPRIDIAALTLSGRRQRLQPNP
jgi:hypothetical protein